MANNYGSTEGSIEGSTEAATDSNAASSSSSQQQQLPVNHLSTYTAGEDAGRLATLAKEFGLSRTRAPKSQVRARVTDSLATLNLESLKVRFLCMYNIMYHVYNVIVLVIC